tara:strand:+ start:485 stop:1819 length:1335 start_codon:yes stop_codon:yes gene_type:complete
MAINSYSFGLLQPNQALSEQDKLLSDIDSALSALSNIQNSPVNVPNYTNFGNKLSTLGGFGDQPGELLNQEQLAKMTQDQINAYDQERKRARTQGIAELLMRVGDAFQGRDATGLALQRKQARDSVAVSDAYIQAIKNAELAGDFAKANLLRSLGLSGYQEVQRKKAIQELSTPTERKIIKAADGFNYYADTGERVLPNVIGKDNKPDRKYEKAEDGFYRYVDDGSKVFGDVEIVDPNFIQPTEDNPMGLNKKEIFERSDKLSDDFRAGSKDFIVSRDSMKRILDAANDPSPFGDLSIIFSAMKVLDPNSVVRESEFKTVADAAPLLERLGFSKDKIQAVQAGNKLTDAQRADVVGTVLDFYKSAVISQKSLEEFYSNKAVRSGLKPEDVIFDYGATVVPKIKDFEFIVSLQNMTIEQLQNLDRSKFTEKEKNLFLNELKKRNQ